MRDYEATQQAYMAVKTEIIRLVEEHEADRHGGLPCELERRNALAFLAHGLGVRGDESLFELENLIAEHDRRCPARSCPDARKASQRAKCSYPECRREARYVVRDDGKPDGEKVYSCLVHGPTYSEEFNDWDARARCLAWERRRAGGKMPLAADGIREAAAEIAARWAELEADASMAGTVQQSMEAERLALFSSLSEIMSRRLLGDVEARADA